MAKAHARAEALKENGPKSIQDEEMFSLRIARLLQRYGCSSDRIATRGVEIADFSQANWEEMKLFSLKDGPFGPTMGQRSAQFREIAGRACATLLPKDLTPPDHLIHVTCTGYISPSCAQEQVVQNRWHEKTVVTHAYHMGCYASLPAVRMAEGFLAVSSHDPSCESGTPRVDILHTEVCSLHVQVYDHSPEQLIVQSLFADGFIVYSAVPSTHAEAFHGSGLSVDALHEELVPGTIDAITWECSEWGMRMGLSPDVPRVIATALQPFVERLCRRGGVSFPEIRAKSVFAVHPGGPKIIDRVQSVLHLQDEQLHASRMILKTCGNMSSATLPHVWEQIIADPTIASGTFVVSLAFGPGLCISGALSRKVG